VSTTAYDSNGRVIEVNGPLVDSSALDKKTTTYWPSGSGDSTGQVRYETLYVGTSASNMTIVTELSNYDLFGVPHKVIGPNGDYVTYDTTDRLTWTIKQWSPTNVLLATSTVVLNADGTVRSMTDADGVCLTYEYSDASGYVGAPTRIKRSMTGAVCGAVPISISTGEVEIRTYTNGESDRLASVTRQLNNVVQVTYTGFVYDKDRRVVSASTINSAQPYTFQFDDVFQTGTTAPGAPANGTWKTSSVADAFARPTELLRHIDATNTLKHVMTYSTPFSPRPTQMTRGLNGAATSVTTFVYDDLGRLVDTTVPESGAPGSPAPTRYEYDVAGRMVKKRLGVGTAMVRTDVSTYDSLGRVLFVDNDTEHNPNPVNCASLPVGTPIQDEEYRYDGCGTDVPTGFSCDMPKGRRTIARSVVQCGTSGAVVKRGRWYDYDYLGRVDRIAYATVTGSAIATPAIVNIDHTAAGRVSLFGSPFTGGAENGTAYQFQDGRPRWIDAGNYLNAVFAINYFAFGGVSDLQTDAGGGGTHGKLGLANTLNSDGSLNKIDWTLGATGGIALISQTMSRTPAGPDGSPRFGGVGDRQRSGISIA
jgi:hypothetical protein